MHFERLLDDLCQQLAETHQTHTVLLYGSHADRTAGPESDIDIAAFAPVQNEMHLGRQTADGFVDLFIYPEVVLLSPSASYLKLRASRILRQRGADGQQFLQGLEQIYLRGPQRLAADECATRKAWAEKMAVRIERGDVEGNYRRVWLLTSLLEDYFQLRGLWYEGPKKSLRWLEAHDARAAAAFSKALKPGADIEAIRELVLVVTASF